MTSTTTPHPLHELSERLWAAAIDRDEPAAMRLVTAAADAGVDAEALLLDVVAGVQHRIGVEWAADRISVAAEHAASAITDRVLAALAHHQNPHPLHLRTRGRVTVACVEGEWHVLPARLLAEVLTHRGWHVDFLGGHTPTPHLVAHVHQTNPTAVLLSASLPTRLPTAHNAISALQSIGVSVMAGGAAFGADGRYARLLRADAWAPDAREAAARLDQGLTQHHAGRRQQIDDDLPHLTDQEYTLVVTRRTALVKQSLAALDARWPAMRTYSTAQRERTAEDIAHIVDFLAVALYVDDAELFTGFTTWTAGILHARHVPAAGLHLGLEVLAGQLRDFPRTLTFLKTATEALQAGSHHTGPGITA
ncbi:B12-binding domain-containing protein [Streptomyces flavochromogenes]|uniref:B12-binding domain-containing protein n=1 Tax=Streptomyces flavochromogenes TaxID=68199 RepID=A0ABW6Y0W9_9ACTN|nr:cobalamin B12-binding domain-containing protein [Streptomyces flavochromogenes]